LSFYPGVVLALVLSVTTVSAYAQPFPIPPPLQSGFEEEEHIAEGDKTPPQIEILTDELTSGKNVFRVKITDESSLRIREVRYIQDGQFRTEGLFRDQNDVYKALIDIQPPSRIVVVTAGDAAGNIATEHGEFEIAGRQDIFMEITNFLSAIPDYLERFLQGLRF
jgi:hypothetical protein